MKKIIDGKVYNTETAKCLAEWDNGYSYSDFRFCEEGLYRTRNGRYFIHGKGGAMTRYSERCGNNSYCEGEDIRPVTEAEAKEWVEENANSDYEAIFGAAEEA